MHLCMLYLSRAHYPFGIHLVSTAAGLVTKEDAIQQQLTPKHFADMARQVCPAKLEELATTFPKVSG